MIDRLSRRLCCLLCALLLVGCGMPSSPMSTPASSEPPPSSGTPDSSALRCPDAPGPIAGPIVFIADNHLIALSEDGSTRTQITTPPESVYTHEPFWSPDGETLTFMWTLFGANPQNIQETTVEVQLVCGLNRHTGKGSTLARREKTAAFFDEASWTPDGRSLIVTLVPLNDDTKLPTLNRLDLSSGELYPLIEQARNAVLSPDGTQLAYLRVEPQPDMMRLTLMLAGADGSNQRPATRTEPPFNYMAAPSWSADGQRLLFTAAGGPGTDPATPTSRRSWWEYALGVSVAHAHSVPADLWIMDRDGQHLRRLTSGLDDPRSAFSPDGQRLVFTGDKQGGVFILDIASGQTQRISEQGTSSGITWAKW